MNLFTFFLEEKEEEEYDDDEDDDAHICSTIFFNYVCMTKSFQIYDFYSI